MQNVDETLFTIINYITSGSASCSGFVIFFEKLEARVPINMFFKIGCFNESDQPPLASYGSSKKMGESTQPPRYYVIIRLPRDWLYNDDKNISMCILDGYKYTTYT